MKWAAVLVLALPSLAQVSGADLANPAKLGEPSEFKEAGVTFRSPEGSLAIASEGREGQTVLTSSRIVKADGREMPLGFVIEVFLDVDFETYLLMVAADQGARGLPPIVVSRERSHGREAWRADLPSRAAPITRILVVDGVDRVVSMRWSLPAELETAYGAMLADAAASLQVEAREPAAVPTEPTVEWARKDERVSLKHPDGWRVLDTDSFRTLVNPRDRFETLAFGHIPRSLADVRAEWEALLKKPGAARLHEGRDQRFGARDGFVARSSMTKLGVEIVAETRFIEREGKCFFLVLSTRASRRDDRRAILDAVAATLRFDD